MKRQQGNLYSHEIVAIFEVNVSNQIGKVIILMGSASDHETMQPAREVLREFDVPHEYMVASAHRCPAKVREITESAEANGVKAFIAGAGSAAHLAGAVAAHTTLPVIGVPIASTSLQGLDSLLATVQMPGGIPVATVAIGPSGAKNAGLLAVQMLACNNAELAEKLKSYRQKMTEKALNATLPD